jgi:hypothetical protein
MEDSDDALLLGGEKVRVGVAGTWLRDGFDIELSQYVNRISHAILDLLLLFSFQGVYHFEAEQVTRHDERRRGTGECTGGLAES